MDCPLPAKGAWRRPSCAASSIQSPGHHLPVLLSFTSHCLLPTPPVLPAPCRLGHATTVRRLLQLGADASGVGQPLPSPAPKPYSPLSAVVLTSAGNERAMAAAPTIVKLLLVGAGSWRSTWLSCRRCGREGLDGACRHLVPQSRTAAGVLLLGKQAAPCLCFMPSPLLQAHGADPLAPSVRRRCSTLRCACGSEFLRNGARSCWRCGGTLPLHVMHSKSCSRSI